MITRAHFLKLGVTVLQQWKLNSKILIALITAETLQAELNVLERLKIEDILETDQVIWQNVLNTTKCISNSGWNRDIMPHYYDVYLINNLIFIL